ncbi:MAG: hypothetical protein KF847_01105 [Pirellulales bacterium]|nr:hypothetical protein [Pirellulales bacterium]
MPATLHWLLTSTTYGSWLPGDPRGSVTSVRERRPGDPTTASRVEHDRPGEPWEPSLPGLHRSALGLLKAPAVVLNRSHARTLVEQCVATAGARGWQLCGVAVLATHFHVVVEAAEIVCGDKLLGDLKAWGARALTQRFGATRSGTWRPAGGSKRRKSDPRALEAAILYVLEKQHAPLAIWSP